MGIFQQQFNSLLGSALRTSLAGSVNTYINPKEEETKQEVAKDTAQAAKNPLHPEHDKTVETVADYQTKVDVMSPEHEIAGNILGMQEQAKWDLMDMTGRMEHYKQKYLEAMKGQQAKAASSLAVQNRLAAKPHKMTDKQFEKEFYKRAKPIAHGGKE